MSPHRRERTYPTDARTIWRLWTTPDGIARWWAPDGLTTHVDALDLHEGGELLYTMSATAPEAIAFMQSAGMPLATVWRKRFSASPSRRGSPTSRSSPSSPTTSLTSSRPESS